MNEVAAAGITLETPITPMNEGECGTLQGVSKEYSVYPFTDTEEASEKVFEFLQNAGSQEADSTFEFDAVVLSQESLEIEEEIETLLNFLEQESTDESPSSFSAFLHKRDLNKNDPNILRSQDKYSSQEQKLSRSTPKQGEKENPPVKHKTVESVFSLARMFGSSPKNRIFNQNSHNKAPENGNFHFSKENALSPSLFSKSGPADQAKYHEKLELLKDKEKEGRHQDQDQDREDQEDKQEKHLSKEFEDPQEENKKKNPMNSFLQNKKKKSVQKISASTATESTTQDQNTPLVPPSEKITGSMESIFFRFMSLMARILGQAEASAHEIYVKIKARTDDIDVLTLLLSKINNEKGDIDWSKDEEMKKLLERAKEIGVEIPEGKLKWKKDEKALLKDNIQMRKDSMEKMTQLERTDMQRFLQEASQCHQARSNILKLLKEVTDTIIHNYRP